MSKPITIHWPAFSNNSICLAQTLAGAGSLIMNGPGIQNGIFSYLSLERTVSLTCIGDIHLVNFTVTGTLRGQVVSEVIAGPNSTTVETVGFFSTVTSITTNAAVASAVSIGSGTEGHTIWVRSDYHRTVNNATVGVKVLAGAITYTFETSLDDPIVTADPYIIAPVDGVTIPTIPAATDMIDATTSSSANYTWPTHSSRVRVSVSDATGALNFYLLQQAVT